MEELNNTLSSGCDMLENFVSDINTNIKLQEISKKITDNSISKEELIEDKNWCQKILTESHEKEEVMVVIKDFYSMEQKNFETALG